MPNQHTRHTTGGGMLWKTSGEVDVLARATKAADAAEAALGEAEARGAKVRERLATAVDSEVEELATEAAKADALVAAYRARVEAAERAKCAAELEASEERMRQAERDVLQACKEAREIGDAMTARARAFAAELQARANELHDVVLAGMAARGVLRQGERRDATPNPSAASPWAGQHMGTVADALQVAARVLHRG